MDVPRGSLARWVEMVQILSYASHTRICYTGTYEVILRRRCNRQWMFWAGFGHFSYHPVHLVPFPVVFDVIWPLPVENDDYWARHQFLGTTSTLYWVMSVYTYPQIPRRTTGSSKTTAPRRGK